MLDREEDVGSAYWSISRMQTIEECGKRYWFRYVKHSPEQKGAVLKFGTKVHKCLEILHKENTWEDGQIQRLWSDQWLSIVPTINWDEESTSKVVYKNRGLKMLEKYKEGHQDDEVLATEIKFRIKGSPKLMGIIDKITLREGQPCVVDYKTSKYPPDPLVLRADPQLTMYYIAAKELGYETDRLAIHNLLDGVEYWTTRTDKDVESLMDMIHQAQAKARHKMFGRNIGFNCKGCAFKQECLDQQNPTSELPPTPAV